MTLILTSPPVVEPLSLAEAKAHLRVDGSDEDTLITSLVTAARIHIETTTRVALITQSWTYLLDDWPRQGWLELPLSPLISVGDIDIFDENNAPEALDPLAYEVALGIPPRILRARGHVWPRPGLLAGGIHIEMTVGHGVLATDVPEPLRQAIRLLVAHWFENREPVVMNDSAADVPQSVAGLLAPYQPVRL